MRGRVPGSCTGIVWGWPGWAGIGRVAISYCARLYCPLVSGRAGGSRSGLLNRKADVRSLTVLRRHALMLGSWTPVICSRNWSCEVWSDTPEYTYPPTVQGETIMQGTRKPSPTGSPPPAWPVWEVRVTNSSGVPADGVGGPTGPT